MGRINLITVLLLVSVLMNGILLGAGARNWFAEPTVIEEGAVNIGPGRGFNIRGFINALPEDKRSAARERAESHRREMRREIRAVARSRLAAMRALNTEPFDADAAAEAMERARTSRIVLEARAEAFVLEMVADLTPQERATALRAALERGRPARGPAEGMERRGPRDRFGPPPGEEPAETPGEGGGG